jgi:hypothetical protein
MKRLKDTISNRLRGISIAGIRFPMTVLCLIAAAVLMLRLIATEGEEEVLLPKYIFTYAVGAVLGMVVQFAVERYEVLLKKRLFVYLAALVVLIGYFLILLPVPEINNRIVIRTFVTIFALVCMVLWIPSIQSKVNFNLVALVHFKSFFTSLLYSGVLAIGTAAIIAAIDNLLFPVSYKTYLYAMTVIWVVFAPIYYLSLLPRFHASKEEERQRTKQLSDYPRILEILVSNIAIPLICAYTLVLIAYFIKILFTRTWPSGQVGPMVLIYTIAGLVIYILASLLQNKFAQFYRRVFPKILIPIVIMQLISVWIRVNAYGITESRYYILVFGIFSLIAGVILCFSDVNKNGYLALLAAVLAILSIIPPIDAFTVSRNSQIHRLEALLEEEGMLKNENVTKNTNASVKAKMEITSILNYLEQSSYLTYLTWLPETFNVYEDMNTVFGFAPTYSYTQEEVQYASIYLDPKQALPIEGYDVILTAQVGSYMKDKGQRDSVFMVDGKNYRLYIDKTSDNDVRVSIQDTDGTEFVGTGLNEFAKGLTNNASPAKESLSPQELSFDVSQNGYQLRIIFQSINYTTVKDQDEVYDYSIYVLFAAP